MLRTLPEGWQTGLRTPIRSVEEILPYPPA
nr:MAG TPA: hypothetical protein [Caudoviricetes sp.]